MSKLAEILIVAGPNGAGKTSFALQFLPAQLRTYTYVNADEIARRMAAKGHSQAQLDFRAGREMLNRIRQSIELGDDIMIETTLSSANWARHIPVWQDRGYAVILHYLRLRDADSAVARVARRFATGGHGIPEPVIRRRFDRSLINLDSVYKSIVDEWYVFDSLEDQPPILAASWRT